MKEYVFSASDGDTVGLCAAMVKAGHKSACVFHDGFDSFVRMSPFEECGVFDVWVADMQAHFGCIFVGGIGDLCPPCEGEVVG